MKNGVFQWIGTQRRVSIFSLLRCSDVTTDFYILDTLISYFLFTCLISLAILLFILNNYFIYFCSSIIFRHPPSAVRRLPSPIRLPPSAFRIRRPFPPFTDSRSICDLWLMISIRFVCFCVSRFVACDRNYDWRQRKTQLWKRLSNFRVRVFVTSAVKIVNSFSKSFLKTNRSRPG